MPPPLSFMQFGTTFSHRHLKYLSCSVADALDKAISLNFAYLRICTYWDEIEKIEGQYDWSELEKILNTCQQKNQKVVLTLGVKAPRWPEYYFPDWIKHKDLDHIETQTKILNFITKTITQLQKFSCIKYYQIENEALDPSGPKQLIIPVSFLKEEIALSKKLDPKKIIVSLWGNQLSKRSLLPTLTEISDIVGLDLYYHQFTKQIFGKSFYQGPADEQNKIKKILTQSTKEIWIMELQAEPWEENHQGYLAKKPQSISPQKIATFYQKASHLPVSTVFFWGFEYWFYQLSKRKNNSYFEIIKKISNVQS